MRAAAGRPYQAGEGRIHANRHHQHDGASHPQPWPLRRPHRHCPTKSMYLAQKNTIVVDYDFMIVINQLEVLILSDSSDDLIIEVSLPCHSHSGNGSHFCLRQGVVHQSVHPENCLRDSMLVTCQEGDADLPDDRPRRQTHQQGGREHAEQQHPHRPPRVPASCHAPQRQRVTWEATDHSPNHIHR